ncbi:MAG: peptide deformylase, partial [Wenzhouxiangellaceae bacterium]
MTQLAILRYPDPRLRTVARPVDQVDDDVRQLVDDMLETMYSARGIGLAATQVNQPLRLLVMDLSEDNDQPLVLINPEIVWSSEAVNTYEEGCLSIPEMYA